MPRNFALTFQKGTLLTGELLSLLYREPRQTQQLLFAGYADGVVSGLRLSVEDGKLKVGPGLYLYAGSLFRQDEEQEIRLADGEFEDGCDYAVYLKLRETRQTENITQRRLDLEVYRQDAQPPDSSPLFCFYGRPYLPTRFQHLFERAFRLLSFPCAAYGEATFLPLVFSLIREELTRKQDKHALDFLLINDILRYGTVPREMLRVYIREAGLPCSEQDLSTGESLLSLFGEAMKRLHPTAASASEPAPADPSGCSRRSQRDSLLI